MTQIVNKEVSRSTSSANDGPGASDSRLGPGDSAGGAGGPCNSGAGVGPLCFLLFFLLGAGEGTSASGAETGAGGEIFGEVPGADEGGKGGELTGTETGGVLTDGATVGGVVVGAGVGGDESAVGGDDIGAFTGLADLGVKGAVAVSGEEAGGKTGVFVGAAAGD